MSLRPKPNRKFVFTKRSLESLRPHDKSTQKGNGTEYSDAGCIGLKAIIGPSGRIHFLHRFTTPQGRKGGMALGEYLPGITKIDDVRKKVYAQKALLSEGHDPREERQQKKQMLSFTEFATEHYLPHAKIHKKSWQEDVWKIEKAMTPAFGDKKLDAISANIIKNFHNSEMKRTSGSSANHMIRLLGRNLRLARDWGFLDELPRLPEKFKEKSRERFLSKKELGKFLAALDQLEDTGSISAIKLLLFTGCRRNEILSLKKQNVNLEEGTIFLSETKTGKSRTVFLAPQAKAILTVQLDRTKDTDVYVFPGVNGSFQKDVRKPFERVKTMAGIEDFRLHDLRHTFATYAAAKSGIHSVSKALGHSDISMTSRYAHHMSEELRKTVDQAAEEMTKATA